MLQNALSGLHKSLASDADQEAGATAVGRLAQYFGKPDPGPYDELGSDLLAANRAGYRVGDLARAATLGSVVAKNEKQGNAAQANADRIAAITPEQVNVLRQRGLKMQVDAEGNQTFIPLRADELRARTANQLAGADLKSFQSDMTKATTYLRQKQADHQDYLNNAQQYGLDPEEVRVAIAKAQQISGRMNALARKKYPTADDRALAAQLGQQHDQIFDDLDYRVSTARARALEAGQAPPAASPGGGNRRQEAEAAGTAYQTGQSDTAATPAPPVVAAPQPAKKWPGRAAAVKGETYDINGAQYQFDGTQLNLVR